MLDRLLGKLRVKLAVVVAAAELGHKRRPDTLGQHIFPDDALEKRVPLDDVKINHAPVRITAQKQADEALAVRGKSLWEPEPDVEDVLCNL